MQNIPLTLRRSAVVATAFAALCSLPLSAASLDNWTQYSGNPITDLNTNHPVIGNGSSGSAGNHTLYSVTPTYKLEAVGESLTFSGKANFQGVSAVGSDQFRFGIYNSNGTTPGTGAANVSGWLGYFGSNAGTGGNPNSRLWKRLEGNDSSFGSSSGAAGTVVVRSELYDSGGNVVINGDYSFSMVLTKTADGINVAWSMTGLGEGATYAFSGSWLDTSPNADTFDRVGLFLGGGVNAGQVSLADLDLTFSSAIPEPATTAALASLAVLGFVMLRRRCRR